MVFPLNVKQRVPDASSELFKMLFLIFFKLCWKYILVGQLVFNTNTLPYLFLPFMLKIVVLRLNALINKGSQWLWAFVCVLNTDEVSNIFFCFTWFVSGTQSKSLIVHCFQMYTGIIKVLLNTTCFLKLRDVVLVIEVWHASTFCQ